jgi:hypothetical protein
LAEIVDDKDMADQLKRLAEEYEQAARVIEVSLS